MAALVRDTINAKSHCKLMPSQPLINEREKRIRMSKDVKMESTVLNSTKTDFLTLQGRKRRLNSK
ncbi:hypothetical protein L915_18059 [Phytophthora nicotianae]|uniref:Uncharacterized protein n=1 Tax=Phytophthora nicotianae TaxID=4792 RepID=W2FZ19_PHYNI|nr:hypothetical protein L915_18059 [Phytophthora nicotianae]ETL28739.1 hypothetical protein L916_17965 [Phytophthora nicotianae]ETM35175.1 hypothetical protein L914_17872 [Phytophthora nicotianae]